MYDFDQYHPIFQRIVNERASKTTNQNYWEYRPFICAGKYKGYSRYSDNEQLAGIYMPAIPEYEIVGLEDAISDSIEKIKEFVQNKKTYLILSGGIDSTLTFYALLKSKIKFDVIVNNDFEQEYFLLKEQLETHAIPNINMYCVDDKPIEEYIKDSNNVFITGEIGDQIIGSVITTKFNYRDRIKTLSEAINEDTFRIVLPFSCKKFYENYTVSVINYFKDVLLFLKDIGLKNVTDITVAEFLWALNFIYKYLFVLYRSNVMGLVPYGDNKNCYHFFDTEKFQQYAMSHYIENCRYIKPNEYKQQFKDWIYTQNGDEEYRRNKLKVSGMHLAPYWNKIDGRA